MRQAAKIQQEVESAQMAQAFADLDDAKTQNNAAQKLFEASRRDMNFCMEALIQLIGHRYVHHNGFVYWVERTEGLPSLLRSAPLVNVADVSRIASVNDEAAA